MRCDERLTRRSSACHTPAVLRDRLLQSRALGPLESARTLAAECYVSDEVFAHEREQVFARSWLPVAREEDLANAGDYVTMDVVGDPIVVTRARDGALHAMANVCRHRNTTIVEGAGNVPSLQCPYHRWTYSL